MAKLRSQPLPRRSFVTHAALAGAVAAIGSGAPAAARAQDGARFTPARHQQDDWLELPGRHRFYLDALTAPGAGDALLFATNYLNSNKTAYQLADSDAAVVICLRHFATPYAWNDGIWAKYGAVFAALTKLNDPKTGKAPAINLYNTEGYGMQLNNLGATVDSLVKRGVHLAVCDMATHVFAGAVARQIGADAESIYKEMTSNTLPNAHYVAAGIVATNRAQERGYTLAHCG